VASAPCCSVSGLHERNGMHFLQTLFSSSGFQPHGFCYAWNSQLVWLHVVSDLLIAGSYFAIPVILLWFIRKRSDIPFGWLFVLFGVFIIACGATHLLEIWNLWHAQYWLAGALKAVTAVASVGTAASIAYVIPRILQVPNLSDWAKANADLETRVLLRTRELGETNDALRHSREALGLAQKAGKMGTWDRDVATGRSTWTAELDEVFGVIPGTPNDSSQMWPNFVHPDDLPNVDKAIAASLQGASDLFSEFRIIRPDGQQRWISARGTVLRDGQGRPNRMVGINIDIAEQKLAEEQIRSLNATLESRVVERTRELSNANRELESFSYSVSHDLRAPLRTIDGFSLALLEDCSDKLDDLGKGHLQRIRTAAQRMGALIDDLLNLSRVTRAQLTAQKFDLSSMVTAVAQELQASQPERQISWHIQPGVSATGDAQLIRVAIENLLNNAWKFTSRRINSSIEFGKTNKNGGSAFFVKDDGAGFNPAYADRLFGTFQRLHATTEFPGTGVGLATVRRIIDRHGGDIWAESSVDHGATFFFTLPQSDSLGAPA
jgi:signal transduction histidine kinase